MSAQDVIETVAIMLGVGLVSKLAADFARLPQMLILLAAGALLGPSGLDAIDVPLDSLGAQLVLTIGVSFILFHGGLQLSARVLERVAVGLVLLVIPGVIITAVVTGTAAAGLFGLPLTTGLLIGAVLAATDPAILVPLFDRIRLRPKVSQTIIAESALNDPTGAVLALAVAGVVASGSPSLTKPLTDFVVDLGVSTVLGCVYGVVLSAAVSSRRSGIWRESAAIAVMAVITGSFFSIDSAGGSGYLGAFLAGLIVGNMSFLKLGMHSTHELEMRVLVSNVADVMVMFVFITLGANLPWRSIADHLFPALGVIVVLIVVARPLAILTCLLPDRRARWTKQELLFLAWTRETGVVPAALAGIIVAMGIAHSDLVVTTVALAVVVTLSVQSTTKRWLAGRLDLLEEGEYVGGPPVVSEASPSEASL
ncbi:MAG TPA: cation:proton antiporter [Gaiellaceae bacterium]|jgi:cell volume regulation protein A|nr:cation:proton antiporter [Gaiellaceae bacterium]